MKIKDVILGSALLGATLGQAQNEVAADTSKDLSKTMITTKNQQSHAEDIYTLLPGEDMFRAELKTPEHKKLGEEILNIARYLHNQMKAVQIYIDQQNREKAGIEHDKLDVPGEKMRELMDKLVDNGVDEIIYNFGDGFDEQSSKLKKEIIAGKKIALDQKIALTEQQNEEEIKKLQKSIQNRKELNEALSGSIANRKKTNEILISIRQRYEKTMDGTNTQELEEFKTIQDKFGKEKVQEVINNLPSLAKDDINKIIGQN